MKRSAFFDINENGAAVYLIDRSNGGCVVRESLPFPSEGGPLFSGGKGTENIDDFCVSLPLSFLNFRVMEFPFSDMEKIRRVLPLELDPLVLNGVSSVIFDAFLLGQEDGKFKVFVAYIAKDKLRAVLERFKPYGVDPRLVTSIELASVLKASVHGADLSRLLMSPPAIDEKERVRIAFGEIGKYTVNFRNGEFVYTVDSERMRKSLKVTAALAVLIMILFFSDTALRVITTKRAIASVTADMSRIYRGLFPREKTAADGLYMMKAHLKELKDKESTFVGISPLKTLMDLSDTSAPSLSLNEITMEGDRAILKGDCASLTDVQQVKSRLEKAFTGVSVAEARQSTRGRILFTIMANRKKG